MKVVEKKFGIWEKVKLSSIRQLFHAQNHFKRNYKWMEM